LNADFVGEDAFPGTENDVRVLRLFAEQITPIRRPGCNRFGNQWSLGYFLIFGKLRS
jgi:hypothetical protein